MLSSARTWFTDCLWTSLRPGSAINSYPRAAAHNRVAPPRARQCRSEKRNLPEHSRDCPGTPPLLGSWNIRRIRSPLSSLDALFLFGRRQIVLAGNHLSIRLAFKFQSGALGDLATHLCSLLVGGQVHRRRRLRNLTRGKLGQGREDGLRLSDLLAGVSYA